MKIDHRRVAIAAFSSVLMGCTRAPSVDVLGSFFPVWMVCLGVAVILTFFARNLIVRCKLESHVGPVALFYPSAVVLLSCALWLIFYR